MGVEVLFLDRQPLDLRAHRLDQLCAILLDSRRFTPEQIASCGRGVELLLDLPCEFLGLAQYVLGAGDLPVSFLQFSDLRLHRPDHLVQPAGLGCGVVDGFPLGVERLCLDRYVLSQCIQRLEPFVGRRRQLVEGPQGCDLRLEILHGALDGGGAFRHLFRGPAQGIVIVRQR